MLESVRLNKYISESGMCSRREADRLIEKGMVKINGNVASVGSVVKKRDKVMVNGMFIEPKKEEHAVYLAFNKPVGITSTTDASDKSNIIDYISYGERIFPIGRLDKDSQGLILLTSNGDIVNQILRAGNKHEKEYLVTVDKLLTPQIIEKMATGVPILGQVTKKCKVVQVTPTIFSITLIQGLNRQIRRMCEHFGFEVVKLERTRIMHLELKGLGLGEHRELHYEEIEGLFAKLEGSRSDSSKSNRNDAIAKQKAEVEQTKLLKKITAAKKEVVENAEPSKAQLEYEHMMKIARAKEFKNRKPTSKGPKSTQNVQFANAQRSAKGNGKKVEPKASASKPPKKSGNRVSTVKGKKQ
jgi:23S rRNA pseudouridine2604 synthase